MVTSPRKIIIDKTENKYETNKLYFGINTFLRYTLDKNFGVCLYSARASNSIAFLHETLILDLALSCRFKLVDIFLFKSTRV